MVVEAVASVHRGSYSGCGGGGVGNGGSDDGSSSGISSSSPSSGTATITIPAWPETITVIE